MRLEVRLNITERSSVPWCQQIGVGVDGSDRKPYDNAISILVASNLEDISNSTRVSENSQSHHRFKSRNRL